MTANSNTDEAAPDNDEVWAVLANGDRRAIVQALAVDPIRGGVGLSINQLADDVGLTRSATCRHLAIGWIAARLLVLAPIAKLFGSVSGRA